MIGNFDITEIMGLSEKIQQFIPQVKKFIPQLKEFEKAQLSKMNLGQGEFLLYSAMLNNSGLIFIYVFKCAQASEVIINGKKYLNVPVVIDQVKKIELTQYLNKIEKEGLMGLLTDVMQSEFMNNIKI